MKTITLLAAVALFMVSCSDDDSKKETCDCQKITLVYNETTETFDPVNSVYFSNDCSDRTESLQQNGDGTYYRINCTPAD